MSEQTYNVTDGVNIEPVTTPQLETPVELAPKMHAPYPEKPEIQVLHESLNDKTPTGYAPHTDVDAGAKIDETLHEAGAVPNAPEEHPDAQPASEGGTVESYSGAEHE